jgi:hypothetical protein
VSEFKFTLEQDDADEFSLLIQDGEGCVWRVPGMSTRDAVGLFKAVTAGIGEYVAEMEQARREFNAGIKPRGVVDSFEGHGDFNSDDPMERFIAHQAAKGNL